MKKLLLVPLIVTAWSVGIAAAHPTHDDAPDAVAHYLANEGVMVVQGETKILFDPLFHNDVGGLYQLVPEEMRAKLMAGEPPYDGIDAVFISHAHGDHFDAADMNDFLAAQPNVLLVAPGQAVALMQQEPGWDPKVNERIRAIDMAAGDAPEQIALDWITVDGGPDMPSTFGIDVEAVRIPHAGGPARAGIQNMVYRVTLDEHATVMHLGDAGPDREEFARYADHWSAQLTHMAFIPDWFIAVWGGQLSRDQLNAEHIVGVHVQVDVPQGLIESGEDYFSVPGETRVITIGGDN